jgi:hypothetical protein
LTLGLLFEGDAAPTPLHHTAIPTLNEKDIIWVLDARAPAIDGPDPSLDNGLALARASQSMARNQEDEMRVDGGAYTRNNEISPPRTPPLVVRAVDIWDTGRSGTSRAAQSQSERPTQGYCQIQPPHASQSESAGFYSDDDEEQKPVEHFFSPSRARPKVKVARTKNQVAAPRAIPAVRATRSSARSDVEPVVLSPYKCNRCKRRDDCVRQVSGGSRFQRGLKGEFEESDEIGCLPCQKAGLKCNLEDYRGVRLSVTGK